MPLVTVYQYPVIGTTPPTAAQMNSPGEIAAMITAQISMLDADTTGLLLHNFGIGLVGQQRLHPMLSYRLTAAPTGGTASPSLVTLGPNLSQFAVLAGNSITNSGPTVVT